MSKNTRGHKKMKLEKISNNKNLQVAFSKRKTGILKQASELSTLCPMEIVVIVCSPIQKVYSFGNSTFETVINRYVSGNPPPITGSSQLIKAYRNGKVNQLNMQLNQIRDELDIEKKRGPELDRIIEANKTHCWWKAPIEELNLSQLEVLKGALEDLKNKVAMQAQ